MAEKTASIASYVGGATAALSPLLDYFGLTPADFSMLMQAGGFAVGVAGLFATIWFKHQHLKLARIKAGLPAEEE